MRTALLIPATHVLQVGRKLEPAGYRDLVSQLEEGEKLVGLYVCGSFWSAPWLSSIDDYKGFERHVTIGLSERLGYFAVSEETFYELVTM